MSAAPRILGLPPGLHLDFPAEDYHAPVLGMVSHGALEKLRASPSKYREWLSTPRAPTQALTFGRALHCALFEPEVFARQYAVEPDFGDCRKTDNKKARDAWLAERAGATLISADDHGALLGMSAAMRAHPLTSRMLCGGVPEVTLRWQDAQTGLPCRARADYYVRDLRMAIDLKSTDDASMRAFSRSMATYGYHRQHAHYAAGFEAIGAPVDHFVFVAVEKSPPYDLAIYTLDEGSLERARHDVRRLTERLADCLERDEWPGYPETIQTIELPPWAA